MPWPSLQFSSEADVPPRRAGPGATAWVAAAVWLGIFVYAYVHARLSPAYGGPVPGFSDAFRSNLGLVVTWLVATPVILWSAVRYPVLGDHWARHLAAHVTAATAFIVASNGVACAIGVASLGHALPPGAWSSCTARALVAWFHYAMLVYFLIVALGQLGAWAAERRAHRTHAAELRAQVSDAQLRALQSQLYPHFLYNALNTVTGLVLTRRNAEAVEMLTGIGDLLRRLLAPLPGGAHETTLADEMRFAEEYLAIEAVRFSDRLRVSCTLAPDLAAALVPRFILQPIVENAVRHGIAPLARGGRIDVTALRVGDRLRLQVSDDGVGWSPEVPPATAGLGTGLANVRERLRGLYGEHGLLAVHSRPGGGTDVVLECPYRVASTPARRAS